MIEATCLKIAVWLGIANLLRETTLLGETTLLRWIDLRRVWFVIALGLGFVEFSGSEGRLLRSHLMLGRCEMFRKVVHASETFSRYAARAE